MALSPEEKQRMLMILTLLSQGQGGRSTLAALQPLIAMWEQKQNESKLKKEQRRQERNAIGSQVGGIAGQLGGMYLIGQALAPAAAAAPVAAGAPAVAAPKLIGAQMVGTGGTASGAGSAGASTLGSVGLPAAAIIAGLSETWESGGKDIIRGRGNRQDWTNMGLNAMGGVGPNLVLRWMGKPSLGRMMTSGKSDAQLMRDDFRGVLKEKGIVDKDYNVTLANGSKFNLGLDGKTKYTNVDGKTTRNAWDVDLNDPLAQYAVSKIDPYIRTMYGNTKGMNPEQYTGMVVNAVTNGAKSQAEIDANIEAVLGKKPFEGNAPIRATSAAPTATPTAAPTPAPAPAPSAGFMAPPSPAPAPATRPPAPIQSSFSGPLPVTPPPQAKPAPQGLLSFGDQLKQNGGNMDLQGMLNLLNQMKQNGAKA